MKIQSFDNSFTFGNAKGGIKYLKIIKNKNGLRFVNTTKEASDAGVFVAGGQEIDKAVREANLKTIKSDTNPVINKENKSGVFEFFKNLFKS